MQITTLEKGAETVKSRNRIFFQGAAMTPVPIIKAICNRFEELKEVEIVHMHTEGEAPYAHPPYQKVFRINSCFVGQNVRSAVSSPSGDYIPIFLSEIHQLFDRNILPLDIAFIQVSPPDQHGYCSLGTSVDITLISRGRRTQSHCPSQSSRSPNAWGRPCARVGNRFGHRSR